MRALGSTEMNLQQPRAGRRELREWRDRGRGCSDVLGREEAVPGHPISLTAPGPALDLTTSPLLVPSTLGIRSDKIIFPLFCLIRTCLVTKLMYVMWHLSLSGLVT